MNLSDRASALKPVCPKCYWRMGGPDSWDGVSCKCGARIKRAPDQARALAHYVPMAREAELHATIERLHADLCAARRDLRLLKSEDPTRLVRWSSLPAIVRSLGMPQATEDLQALLGALSHVVVESGMDDPEGCVTHLDKASDAAEALRVMDSDEMALAHREYVREMEDDDRRAGV